MSRIQSSNPSCRVHRFTSFDVTIPDANVSVSMAIFFCTLQKKSLTKNQEESKVREFLKFASQFRSDHCQGQARHELWFSFVLYKRNASPRFEKQTDVERRVRSSRWFCFHCRGAQHDTVSADIFFCTLQKKWPTTRKAERWKITGFQDCERIL